MSDREMVMDAKDMERTILRMTHRILEVHKGAAEVTLIGLFLASLATGAAQQLGALDLILGGAYTVPFWLWFFVPGLLMPWLLGLVAVRGNRAAGVTAAVLVVFGGFMLRYLMVEMGQVSTWTDYAVQFDPQLLQRLMP